MFNIGGKVKAKGVKFVLADGSDTTVRSVSLRKEVIVSAGAVGVSLQCFALCRFIILIIELCRVRGSWSLAVSGIRREEIYIAYLSLTTMR